MVLHAASGLPEDVEFARFLGEIQPLTDRVTALAPPALGSSLRRDDELAAPYKPSHSIRRTLAAAVEHLDALRSLLLHAGVQHPTAPFTLVRASIETASTSLWLLTGRRAERVERTLRLAMKDLTDQGWAEGSMGLTPTRPLDDQFQGVPVRRGAR